MPRLLVVHHTPSPATHDLLLAAVGAVDQVGLESVDVVVRPALGATASDVLDADGVLLGTPANLGYLSGALKHFFDTVYYPCLDATVGRPYGAWIHGNDDVEGARRGLERIVTGLRWRAVADPVLVTGGVDGATRAAVSELAATVAATLLP